ncbi:phage tail protein [Kitasatospora sp. NBC_00240]|uniref:phage tail protein n=1 Tax=Kitasatospora sp. NBC_00240 TaxID=2903567 RepID=UPI0022534A57|nr:phage tail protein [Kitasatospora sp. NBC_00240]MCX5213552.1 phage tail protein [Kitasatospora sp. NBC_00240]
MTLPYPGTSVHFQLQISGIDLGDFSTCSGLGAQVEVEQRAEGGNNSFVWQLPTRITYPNVTLSRGLTPDTAKVSRFLATLPTQVTRGSAQITALTPQLTAGPVLASWALREVIVVRWTGPSFDPSRSEVATESIELAHHGFL